LSGRLSSPHSEAAYRRDLCLWALYVADLLGRPDPAGADPERSGSAGALELLRLDPMDLAREVLEAALAAIDRDGNAPVTRALMVRTLKGFCDYLVRHGYLSADPPEATKTPRVLRKVPGVFSSDDLRRLVEVASTRDRASRNPWPARDRAALAILAGTGVRASEAVALKVEDLVSNHEDGPVLRVGCEGRQERLIPLPAEVVGAVEDYHGDRAHRLGPYNRSLFKDSQSLWTIASAWW
jgi:site-specific recombinase XerD